MFASELRLASDPSRLDGAGDAYHVSGLPWRIAHGERAPIDDASPGGVLALRGSRTRATTPSTKSQLRSSFF
jgi:hypothetical protein